MPGYANLQVEDLIYMQHANVMNLPENYNMKYCMLDFHLAILQAGLLMSLFCAFHNLSYGTTARPLSCTHMAAAVICS